MSDASRASRLRTESLGHSSSRRRATKNTESFAPPPLDNSRPDSTLAANDPNYDKAQVVSMANKRKGDATRQSPKSNQEPVYLTPERLKEIRNLKSLDDRKEELAREYNRNIPTEGQGRRFDVYKQQLQEILGPKAQKPAAEEDDDVRSNGEDAFVLAGGVANGARRMSHVTSGSHHRKSHARHFLRFRRKKGTKEEEAKRKRMEEEEAKKKAKLEEEKARLREGDAGKPGAKGQTASPQVSYKNETGKVAGEKLAAATDGIKEGETALKSGESAVKGSEATVKGLETAAKGGEAALKGTEATAKGGEAALKGGKAVVEGLKTVANGSKLLRLGTFLAAGVTGFVVGTAALVGGVAIIGGATVGVLAYKYGRASGEKSVASAIKVGGQLLVPQEARDKFSEAKNSFLKGDLWGGLKNGLAGCDEILGISAGAKWVKDQAVDFAKDPSGKMQRIASAVNTGTEAVSVLAHDSNLLDKTLTVAGNMAAGNDTTESFMELKTAGMNNQRAVAFAQANPGMFGFKAIPKASVPAANGPMVTQQTSVREDTEYGASGGWIPEPETV